MADTSRLLFPSLRFSIDYLLTYLLEAKFAYETRYFRSHEQIFSRSPHFLTADGRVSTIVLKLMVECFLWLNPHQNVRTFFKALLTC
jgi:hypothetical protein